MTSQRESKIGFIDQLISAFFGKHTTFEFAIRRIAEILCKIDPPMGADWTARLAKCPARMGREAAVVVMMSAHGELRRAGLSRMPSYL